MRLLIKKARSLMAALFSFALAGDAPLGEYLDRRETCLGIPGQLPKCERLQATDTGLFCGACGCPQWPVSDLRTKWRMPDVACPLGRW